VATATSACRGVILQAPSGNGTTIYVGGSDVTATGSTTGLALFAGDPMILLPIEDASQLYAIGSVSGSNIKWAVL
jgi:hypothetical protein